MRYGSVCSGIEAASVAWAPLGWEAEFFSEIDRFPCEVLAHHYGSNLPGETLARNGVPNLGDMTKFKEWPDAAIDVLVGGTPCQSFSVAGLRAGLADPRGNLMLTYLAIAAKYRPRWVAWENVPGVLSSNGGRDFGTFLRGLGELGYGFAYRVLDAQFCRVDGFERAVPQRRRRVFVVGYLGDWRRAAAVLFDAASLRGDSAPRREAGQGVAGTIEASLGRSRGAGTPASGLIDYVPDIVSQAMSSKWSKGSSGPAGDEIANLIAHGAAPALTSNPYGDHESREGLLVAHSLRAEGFDASEDGTGRGTPLVPIAFNAREDTETTWDRSGPLGASSPQAQAVAFSISQNANGFAWEGAVNPTLQCRAQSPQSNQFDGVRDGRAVRRLTPGECESLQGFPRGYTAIERKGKPAADGPRYKAIGNSMAVNVMRWIGQRIAIVDAMPEAEREDAA